MNTTDYPGARHLLGSYLHQDFAEEFPSAMAAVETFATKEPRATVESAVQDFAQLSAEEAFIDSPESKLFELGCFYDPRSEGLTPAEWIHCVRNVLLARLGR